MRLQPLRYQGCGKFITSASRPELDSIFARMNTC